MEQIEVLHKILRCPGQTVATGTTKEAQYSLEWNHDQEALRLHGWKIKLGMSIPAAVTLNTVWEAELRLHKEFYYRADLSHWHERSLIDFVRGSMHQAYVGAPNNVWTLNETSLHETLAMLPYPYYLLIPADKTIWLDLWVNNTTGANQYCDGVIILYYDWLYVPEIIRSLPSQPIDVQEPQKRKDPKM